MADDDDDDDDDEEDDDDDDDDEDGRGLFWGENAMRHWSRGRLDTLNVSFCFP